MDSRGTQDTTATRTAGDAGWHLSRYNVSAKVPGKNRVAVVNLLRGTWTDLSEMEFYLLSSIEELNVRHPFIERFARLGLIANYDELAAIETMARAACAWPLVVTLTICPTMGCNFDCPYCFERHASGKMSTDVQDDVVALADHMLEATGAKGLDVTWFGGEPLLAPDVIESLSMRFIALTQKRGATYKASIVTNGYLLTPKVAEMLGRARVTSAQITLDGIGATHDATRHLAGGGPTFERIVGNLSSPGLPFEVQVRNNVYAANRSEFDALQGLVQGIAEKSGNQLSLRAAVVSTSEVSAHREDMVDVLDDEARREIMLARYAERFAVGRGDYCGAHRLGAVTIDAEGRLYKCWQAVDKPALSFGTAHDWDPADPIATAAHLDLLTSFIDSTGVTQDPECRACVWLPVCRGGCPYQRLFANGRRCLPCRDDAPRYVLAVRERLRNGKQDCHLGHGA